MLSVIKVKAGTMNKILTIVFILSGFGSMAQHEDFSVGLRLGGLSGFSAKWFDDDLRAVELIAGGRNDGFRLTGLLQKFKPIKTDRIANLYYFTGLGAHAGFESHTFESSYYINGFKYYSYHKVTSPVIGGDLVLGLEYRFESVPVNMSVDFKPYFDVYRYDSFRIDFFDIGFTIRYLISN
jgi:hypothetical protein